jgi:hypothetical protein
MAFGAPRDQNFKKMNSYLHKALWITFHPNGASATVDAPSSIAYLMIKLNAPNALTTFYHHMHDFIYD